ncbi:MAG: glyoxalase [Bacteroidota bacterium]
MNLTDRNALLISLRPNISVDAERLSLPEEQFQQTTLRPILKLQNSLILAYFNNKTVLSNPPVETKARLLFIENTIRKDAVLRNQLIGLVAGLFTEGEFAFYLQHASSLNKRIAQLLIKRIQDQF